MSTTKLSPGSFGEENGIFGFGDNIMSGQERREKIFKKRRDWVLEREENEWTGTTKKKIFFAPTVACSKILEPANNSPSSLILVLVVLSNRY
jgi:hypothetical protein